MSMGLDENLVDMEHTVMKKPWVLVLKEFTAGIVVSSGCHDKLYR